MKTLVEDAILLNNSIIHKVLTEALNRSIHLGKNMLENVFTLLTVRIFKDKKKDHVE